MSESAEAREVNARIVYWGPWGGGKTANLHTAHAKLRPDHRGELQAVPTPLDPSATYERLPFELGQIAGVRTRFQIVAVPGAPDQAPTRKQLLDGVDGVVFVADAQADRLEDNVASLEELRAMLADYGRSLADVPLVVQYNKRDLTDAYALEGLHKRLDLRGAAAFEAVATEGTGVLQTLTTLSKRVIRRLREHPPESAESAESADAAEAPPAAELVVGEAPVAEALPGAAPSPAPAGPAPGRPADAPTRLETAILGEAADPDADALDDVTRAAQEGLDVPWRDVTPKDDEAEEPALPRLDAELSIVSVGEATRHGARAVRLPLVLGDRQGHTTSFVLTIQLDALADPD